MKQLTCEMCGSTDLIKQDGVFVCQTCGCKYSIEEARKMMVEGTVEVTGTVKVDNTAAIENYLKMARNALEASNHEEAENYANKIIELDPQNSPAWEIKGEAAGWQSKANNNRMGEAVTAWLNAVNFAAEDDLDDLRERIANGYTNLFMAMLQLRTGNFGRVQSAENLKSTMNDLKNGIDMMNTLMAKGGISFNRGPIYTQIARKLNDGACDGYKDAKKDFGPEHHNMSKWQWENFTGSCDNCIKMLEKAVEYCRDNKLGQTICDNLVTIAVDARDSCSWKFNVNSWNADNYDRDYSFTQTAKDSRTKSINGYKDKKAFFNKDQVAAVLDEIQGGRKTEEIERAKKVYWEEHASEKAQLETEKASLTAAVSEKEATLNSLQISSEVKATAKRIEDLSKEKASLGLFKGKEKKAIQEQIDALEQTKKQQLAQEDAEKKPLQDEISRSKARITEINSEFDKNRGQLSASSDDYLIPGAIEDGKFSISTQQLADHLSKVLPSTFEYKGIEESTSGYPDFGHQMEIKFVIAGAEEKKNSIGVQLYCTADDKDSVIRNIIMESVTASSAGDESRRNWAVFGSYVFMALFKGMGQSDAEKNALNVRYTGTRTLWVQDSIRYEYAGCTLDLLGLISLNKDALILRPSLGK